MRFETCIITKCFVAIIAFIRFLVGVDALMSIETAPGFESFKAGYALKEFLIAVCSFVLFVREFACK